MRVMLMIKGDPEPGAAPSTVIDGPFPEDEP
jgi:hypothetical protein